MPRLLLTAAVLTCFAMSCVGSSGSEGPARPLPSAFDQPDCGAGDSPPSVPLVTDVSPSDSRWVMLRCAIDVSAGALGDLLSPVEVVAGATIDSLGSLMVGLDTTLGVEEVADAMTRLGSAMFTAPTAVAVDLARVRAEASAAPTERWLLTADVVHELVHVVQWRVSGGDAAAARRLGAEPFWLVETPPTWFADHTMSSVAFDADRRAVAAQVAARAIGFPGLQRWESAEGFGTWDAPATRLPTALRFAALVEIGRLLVDRAGPEALLHGYWMARTDNVEPWSVTFERVFGMTVDRFYAEVDAHFAGAVASGTFE